jgi:hypothetical protein
MVVLGDIVYGSYGAIPGGTRHGIHPWCGWLLSYSLKWVSAAMVERLGVFYMKKIKPRNLLCEAGRNMQTDVHK